MYSEWKTVKKPSPLGGRFWCGADSPQCLLKRTKERREGQAPPLRILFQCGKRKRAIRESPLRRVRSESPKDARKSVQSARATTGRLYSEPDALRMRRSPAIDFSRIARDVEVAVPYDENRPRRVCEAKEIKSVFAVGLPRQKLPEAKRHASPRADQPSEARAMEREYFKREPAQQALF